MNTIPSMPDGATREQGPLVVACLRVTDLRPAVDPLTGSVQHDPWSIGLSPADQAALEHALRICEIWSSPLVAVAAGPATIEPVLREVAALGASVLRVAPSDQVADDRNEHELAEDEHQLARTLVAAIATLGPPGLVLCGDRSSDRGTGALPAFLAHELGATQALGLVRLEAESEGALLAERRLDGGRRERLVVPLPAVCSVEGAGTRLRRASLTGSLDAQQLVIPVSRPPTQPVADSRGELRVGTSRPFTPRTRIRPAPAGDDPRIRLLALTGALVSHDPPTVLGPMGSKQAVDELVAFLVRHGYLEHPLEQP
jgi:electron transfer flavoprotein beta subunit